VGIRQLAFPDMEQKIGSASNQLGSWIGSKQLYCVGDRKRFFVTGNIKQGLHLRTEANQPPETFQIDAAVS